METEDKRRDGLVDDIKTLNRFLQGSCLNYSIYRNGDYKTLMEADFKLLVNRLENLRKAYLEFESILPLTVH